MIGESNAYNKYTDFDTRYFARGEIYRIDLDQLAYVPANVFGTKRVLIISNNHINRKSNKVIVALIYPHQNHDYPFFYSYKYGKNNEKQSVVTFDRILTVDKHILEDRVGRLTSEQMREAEQALCNAQELDKLRLSNLEEIVVVKKSKNEYRSTKTHRIEEKVVFDINIKFKDYTHFMQIDLQRLQKLNSTITDEISFDELQKMLDCCRGIKFLFQHAVNEIGVSAFLPGYVFDGHVDNTLWDQYHGDIEEEKTII